MKTRKTLICKNNKTKLNQNYQEKCLTSSLLDALWAQQFFDFTVKHSAGSDHRSSKPESEEKVLSRGKFHVTAELITREEKAPLRSHYSSLVYEAEPETALRLLMRWRSTKSPRLPLFAIAALDLLITFVSAITAKLMISAPEMCVIYRPVPGERLHSPVWLLKIHYKAAPSNLLKVFSTPEKKEVRDETRNGFFHEPVSTTAMVNDDTLLAERLARVALRVEYSQRNGG